MTESGISEEERLKELLRPPAEDNGVENYGIPPESAGAADEATQEKIARWLQLKESGMHFNARLEKTHAFRNPAIMNKLISYLGLDEIGSNYPSHIYDPHGFPAEAFSDAIVRKQQQRPAVATTSIPPISNSQLASAVQKAQQRAVQFVSNINKTDSESYKQPTASREPGNPSSYVFILIALSHVASQHGKESQNGTKHNTFWDAYKLHNSCPIFPDEKAAL
ncbi:HCNGP-like protein-domain-containing protein, partial [Phlyctochytrium arcticum]